MTQVIMEVKNGNRRMTLCSFPEFNNNYCPWILESAWVRLPSEERARIYAYHRDKHLNLQGRLVRTFVKEGRKAEVI